MTSDPLRTLNVCGAGHSGSTLLGLMVGSHSRAFYAGECAKVRYLADPTKAERKRVCKLCGPGCRIWGDFDWDAERPLYAQIADAAAATVVVDSTKNPRWIRDRVAEAAAGGARTHLVFLTRDGRAVINSRLRKYPDRPAEDQIDQWMRQIEKSETLFASFDGPRLRVRYEELATEPAATAAALCELLDISYEPGMLDFQGHDHHPLGGNNGTQYLVARARYRDPAKAFVTLGDRSRDYYREHDDTIRLDLRWKQEMSAENLALFEKRAGRFNEPLAWEG